MTDRVMVYPGAIPLDSDLLVTNKNIMLALGALAQATIGVASGALWVDGMALTATSPTANLVVTVGSGSIYSLQTVDATPYGSLAADTGDSIVKIGQNISGTPFTLTAPTTAGQSINYLIEATFAEADTNATVLPYYNSSAPASPYLGPANSGTAQNTLRTQRVSLQLKAGAAATTGTQSTPAVDSGWIGLYVLTVNTGQTQVTQSQCNSASIGNAPSIPVKLSQLRRRLSANLTIYVTTTGNDGNDGLTVNTPLQTLQHAWNYIANSVDLNGFSVTVAVGPGTYGVGIVANGSPVGISANNGVAFQGYTSNAFTSVATSPTAGGVNNPTISTTSANCLSFYGMNGTLSAAGFALATGTSGNCIVAAGGTPFTLGANIYFGVCAGYHMTANTSGIITATATYTIGGGGANTHVYVGAQGTIVLNGRTITVSGTPAFSGSFAYAGDCGDLQATSVTFSGSATGTYAIVTRNGIINTGTGVAIGTSTYFPGSAFGTATYGGQYA